MAFDIKSRYDLVICGVGVAALAAGIAFMALGVMGPSEDEAAAMAKRRCQFNTRSASKVEAADMTGYQQAVRVMKTPPAMAEVELKAANFLASERRLMCASKDCGKPIRPDLKECPFCKAEQPSMVKVSLDNDNDGIPNDYEIAHGMNPNDPSDANVDSDNDGFTNLEEYKLGFDPKDSKSHPDYLDYLSIVGKPATTKLTFFFRDVNPIPNNRHRFNFLDLTKVDRFTKRPVSYVAREGEELVDESGKNKPGYTVLAYEKKREEVTIKGGSGLKKMRDVDVVVIKENKTGRELHLTIGQKVIPIDVQARLHFDRGDMPDFDVTPKSSFKLFGVKYHVVSIDEKEGTVLVEADLGGKQTLIK